MPRPIWKGAITFGLVTIPVSLFSATERKRELSFRLLHAKDKSPVDYRRFCSEEEVEVPWSEIVKGYEYEKGQFVPVTDEDFDRARVPASETFEVRDFVPAHDVDPLYFDQPYYLAPSGKTGAKAYALLRDALERSGRLGIGTIVLRQREHLAALQPADSALVLSMMRFSHELRSTAELDLPKSDGAYAKREMDLGLQLIDTLASDWDPTKYKDTYYDVLRQVIEQKVEGKEVKIPAPAKPPKVASLVKALEESLKGGVPRERRPAARASQRRPRRARGRRAA